MSAQSQTWPKLRPPLSLLFPWGARKQPAPQADLNLGIKTFLNGQLVSNIVIDTAP
jgi:hypothetical protein